MALIEKPRAAEIAKEMACKAGSNRPTCHRQGKLCPFQPPQLVGGMHGETNGAHLT